MRKLLKRTIVIFLILFGQSVLFAQEIPDKPQKETLVVDFADILSPQQEAHLEKKLLNYFVQSSTQVAVVTVPSLNGYERGDFATRLAQKWGIGSAKNDNGVLLLVKPKYKDSKGQLFIAVGYGLEGVATDMAVGQIRSRILIPAFVNNDYFGGIDRATDALIALTKGEYKEQQSAKQKSGGSFPFIILVIFILILFLLTKNKNDNNHHNINGTGRGLPLWLLLEMMNGRRGGGSFGDFSSGGGSFGDFGGFGGGSFGGGGAGGSW